GPGVNGPLTLVADLPPASGSGAASPDALAQDKAALSNLVVSLERTPGVAAVQVGAQSADGRVEVISVVPASSPESKQTTNLITTLREQVIPKAEAGTGLQVYVGGLTAVYA